MEQIELEAVEAQTQYEAISTNWESMLTIKDPLDIDAAMKEQKVQCDLLLEQKNALIDALKDDLKKMDVAYFEDLDKQVRAKLLKSSRLRIFLNSTHENKSIQKSCRTQISDFCFYL